MRDSLTMLLPRCWCLRIFCMPTAPPPSKKLTPVLAVATVLAYATGYPLGSASVAVMPPGLVILLRFVASAVVLWLIVAALRLPMPPPGRLHNAVIAGLLIQGVQFLFLYWALANGVSAGLSSLIIALNPVVTSMILTIWTSHRESPRGRVALALGAAAVVVACTPMILEDYSLGLPLLSVIIALLGLSFGAIQQGRHLIGVHPLVITAIGVTVSIPFAGVVALFEPGNVTDWPRALWLIAAMVVFSSIGATTLYATCVARSGARAASILFSVIPATASLLAWVGLGQDLSVFAVVGIVLGASACLVQASDRSRAPST